MGILPVPGHGQDGHGTSRGPGVPLARAAAPTFILGLGSADNRCAEVCPARGSRGLEAAPRRRLFSPVAGHAPD
jgi:hypothetical protein